MESRVKEPDPTALQKFLLFLPIKNIAETIKHVTFNARKLIAPGLRMRKYFVSPNLALQVLRRNEEVGADMICGNVPAYGYDGATKANMFIGLKSHFQDVYPIKSDGDFHDALRDNIRQRGAMDVLRSDHGSNVACKKTKEVLCQFVINDKQSKPKQQHQNTFERECQNTKRNTEIIVNCFGVPCSVMVAMSHVRHLYC
jgi:hypothetical protein